MEAIPRLCMIFNHCMLSISTIEFLLSTINHGTIAFNLYSLAFHHFVIAFNHCMISLGNFDHRIISVNHWMIAFMIASLQPLKDCLLGFSGRRQISVATSEWPWCEPECHVWWGRMDLYTLCPSFQPLVELYMT